MSVDLRKKNSKYFHTNTENPTENEISPVEIISSVQNPLKEIPSDGVLVGKGSRMIGRSKPHSYPRSLTFPPGWSYQEDGKT